MLKVSDVTKLLGRSQQWVYAHATVLGDRYDEVGDAGAAEGSIVIPERAHIDVP